MRLVFAGTPEAAVPSLQALCNSPHHHVVAVITQPDAPYGRGRKLRPSPVALCAEEHGIPILKPHSASDADFLAQLASHRPDCCPVVAYGQLLRPAALEIPQHGWVNLHFSLLPQWRGAAPVQSAIAAGDEISGATTFRLDEGMDSGPIFGTVTETIRPTDTSATLMQRLAEQGARLLTDTMDGIADGSLTPLPQPHVGVSYTSKISTEDARIRWGLPTHLVDRHIRAMTPSPGAWTMLGETRLKIGGTTPLIPAIAQQPANSGAALAPGQLFFTGKYVLVGTATGAIQLATIQAPGKKMMNAADWARGAHLRGDEVMQ
ncbi:MAG: methionyl-tRNA formyltransferase [Corynebacteriales bacterium]|nr:methionyl-tRNA formyltransferase [Mycobacteriales bacterium]